MPFRNGRCGNRAAYGSSAHEARRPTTPRNELPVPPWAVRHPPTGGGGTHTAPPELPGSAKRTRQPKPTPARVGLFVCFPECAIRLAYLKQRLLRCYCFLLSFFKNFNFAVFTIIPGLNFYFSFPYTLNAFRNLGQS